MAWFKVVANRIKCDGVVHLKGEMFETSLDLDKKAFKGVVERIDPAIAHAVSRTVVPTVKAHPVPRAKKIVPPPQEPESPSPPVSAALGEDVTDAFPLAEPEGYTVYVRDELYFVHDPDESDQPLNPEGLKKGKVNDFIKKISKD